jgi:hypothetical protein
MNIKLVFLIQRNQSKTTKRKSQIGNVRAYFRNVAEIKNNKYLNTILIIFYQKKIFNIYKYIFKRGKVNHLSNHLKTNRDFKSSGE